MLFYTPAPSILNLLKFLAQGLYKGKKAEEICSGYTDVAL
jgi:hypothetical protein